MSSDFVQLELDRSELTDIVSHFCTAGEFEIIVGALEYEEVGLRVAAEQI